MTKFNFHNKKKGAAALTIAAFIVLTAVLLFTACPNAAGTPVPPGDKTYNVDGVEFTMKGIATVMNGTVGHVDESKNQPHTVTLSAYRIGETEVTQELWEKVMGTNPSWFNGTAGKEPAGGETQEKRPVESVNWYHCITFCNKLSLKLGLTPCYTVSGINFETLAYADIPASQNEDWNKAVLYMGADGFRLPTEAEWEWAAKGVKNDKWAGTNDESQLGNYAWYDENSDRRTHEVKKKRPNGYGLYDMSGNVWEWCSDLYCAWYYDGRFTSLPPDFYYTSAYGGFARVSRGGDWWGEKCVACAVRFDSPTAQDADFQGFRLVCRP